MTLVQLKPEAIDPGEVKLLVRFAPLAVLIGAGAGFVISRGLWGEDIIGQSFWTETIKIVGLAALPLVALGVRLPRLSAASYQRSALRFMSLGFAAAAGVIMLCLYQVAVVPKDGLQAADWQVTVAMVGAGVTLGALAVGVAAEVLDKIDTDGSRQEDVR